MFTDFFYILRKRKVPVTITEWMTLMEALARGYINNLDEFYFLARAILVKSEAYFDHYDVAFQEYFQGIESPMEITEQILDWLKNPMNRLTLTEEELALFDQMDLDELISELEKRLQEQTEAHDGGDYWIGRGGTSPFGHSGSHPAGIRIGGEGGGRHAVQIAHDRRFRNYRHDLTLDIRQIEVALRGLRQLSRVGPEDELDLEETIEAAGRNAGDIELIWRRSRMNRAKVLLLMDVGGSMEPYALLCSQLFSAAHRSTHFKEFHYYYFHNCVYDKLYEDITRRESTDTDYLLRTLDPNFKVLLVGDATMSPYELTEQHGAINYSDRNEIPGIVWLKRIADHFTHCVWMNVENPRHWNHTTVRMIHRVFPMYPLTIDGLGQAVRKLLVKN
ncbi:MAG: VWA domain-containing protein [Dehalococcoidia bacterium]|nr:MAG: VWA domain-containing protein [Dehalococcoidia bacterium]